MYGPLGTPSTPTPSPTGGGGDIIGPLIAGGMQIASDSISNKQRKKLEKQAREWNLQQWHRQNKYNHPIEQMARLKAAGLNPNLIYGSSPGSAVGNAGSISPGKAPDYSLGNPMIPFMDTRVKQAQSNNLKADVMLKATQGMKNVTEAGYTGKKKELLDEQFEHLVGLSASNATIAKIKAEVATGTKKELIQQAATKTDADNLALKLLEIDLEMAQAGYVKGLTIPQIGTALGFDMSTTQGREAFSMASIIAGGSRIFQMLTPGFKALLPKGLKKGFQQFKKRINK